MSGHCIFQEDAMADKRSDATGCMRESDGESDGLPDKDFDAGDFAEAGCMALVLFWK